MKTNKQKISLGFTQQIFEEGAHICQIFNSDSERHDILVDYIISGLKNNEDVACFSENETSETLHKKFEEAGFSYTESIHSQSFSLSKTADVYFKNNEFIPEKMLGLLKDFYDSSQKKNKFGARVIGEMSPKIDHIKGGTKLLDYECQITLFQQKTPVTAVCQYDARNFSGATILDILKVHPHMIVNGSVISNPFYMTPEEYFAEKQKTET